jgi:hypothetical protein
MHCPACTSTRPTSIQIRPLGRVLSLASERRF